jgi:hypothetical protein
MGIRAINPDASCTSFLTSLSERTSEGVREGVSERVSERGREHATNLVGKGGVFLAGASVLLV